MLRKALDADPSNLAAYASLGQLYYVQGQISRAMTEFENVVTRQPDSVPGHTMLAILLNRQGQPDEAKAHYEKVLAINSRSPVAANNLAWMYATKGENLDVALQLAQTASSQLPDQPEVTDTLAWVYQKKGMSKQAIPLLQRIVEKNPSNPQFLYHLGVALSSSGDQDGAKRALEKALALNPNFADAADARRVLATVQ